MAVWPDANTTQELLHLARQGEREAESKLFSRHRAALCRMVGARMDPVLKRRVDASDIVQNVLLDAHRRLAGYLAAPTMPFHAWLRQMAMDRLIDTHRRHRVAAQRSLDREQSLDALRSDRVAPPGLERAVDCQLTPAAAALRHEWADQLRGALDLLNDDDREVILLRHFEQLGNAEAAEILQVTPPAASMRYLRALRRLRQILDAPGISEPGS